MKSRVLGTVVVLAMIGSAVAIAQDRPRQAPPGGGMPDLVGGLKQVEGCLGVEVAQTPTGKQSIFAWFEDKKAVLRWYHSEMHMGAIGVLTSGETPRKPMEKVSDDAGPILVIATITPSSAPKFEQIKMPISQISIELYEALPGGAHLGGRFAPDTVKVENMADYTPQGGE
jgi:hypothetical protein